MLLLGSAAHSHPDCVRPRGGIPSDVPQAFRRRTAVEDSAAYINDVVTRMEPIRQAILNPAPIEPKRNEQQRVRIAKLATLKAAGWTLTRRRFRIRCRWLSPASWQRRRGFYCGRILRIRDHGGVIFADLREGMTSSRSALSVLGRLT